MSNTDKASPSGIKRDFKVGLYDSLSPTSRSISPHHKIVQFNSNSPEVHSYDRGNITGTTTTTSDDHRFSDSAILTDDDDEYDSPSELPKFKMPQYQSSRVNSDHPKNGTIQEYYDNDNLTSQRMMQTDSDGSSLPFNKRPLSDTPVLSANDSPNSITALSPLVLSESEEDDEDDDNDLMKNISHSIEVTKALRAEEKRVKELTQNNTKLNKKISQPPVFKATLDIPGQTKSKQSPEGKVVNTSERVVVVMIGLPARGKSYLSNKLVRYLNWLQINARLFNVGATRRKRAAHVGPEHSPLPDVVEKDGTRSPASTSGTNLQALTKTTSHNANFFNPDNKESIKLREEWAKETLDNLLDYLLEGDGCVGVFDATNSTKARRKMVLDTIQKRSQGQLKVLFLESICRDESIIEDNIHLKLSGPDYKDMDPQVAVEDFVGRLKNYEKAYETIDEEEEKIKDFQYIKMIDVGRKVIAFNIKGFLASQIIYYFLNFNLYERQIWIARHGESTDNVKGRIGGDAPLTKRGINFSKCLARFMLFKKKEFREKQLKQFQEKISKNHFSTNRQPPEEPSSSVWTSMLRRSIETANYLSENEFDIKQMRMLDELGAGKFDGMSYQEIQENYPHEFQARLENKMTYRYPGSGGESYLDVINRLKPVITEVERTTNHILIITHRVVARVLLGYFLNLNKETIGDLDVPLHTLYLFEPNPFGVEWHMYEYDEVSDWFREVNPDSLENSKKVKQVGITFRERKYSVVPTAPRRQSSLMPSRNFSVVPSSSSSSSGPNGTAIPVPHIVTHTGPTTMRSNTNNALDELQKARGILRGASGQSSNNLNLLSQPTQKGINLNPKKPHSSSSSSSTTSTLSAIPPDWSSGVPRAPKHSVVDNGSGNANVNADRSFEVDELDEKLAKLSTGR